MSEMEETSKEMKMANTSVWVQSESIAKASGRGGFMRLLLLAAVLIGVQAMGHAPAAFSASTNSIYVVNRASATADDYRIYRLSSGGLTQLYQSSSTKRIAVNPSNGDILALSRGSLELLDSSGSLRRKFYTDGDDVNTRAAVPNDSGRGAWGVVWASATSIVWSVEFEAKAPDPDEPNATVGVVVGDLWGMNPYSDSSGSVVASPPGLGSMGWGYTYQMSMSHDGRILGQDTVVNMDPSDHSYNGKEGAWWVYPAAQQAEVWAQYDQDVVDDVCVDAGNAPVILAHATVSDPSSPSHIFIPSTGQSIDLGANAKALACSPDTANQYAVGMKDGRVLVGGSGGFQEVARVPAGEAYDVDWPGLANPRVRVTYPKRNHKYSRRTVRRRFKKIRGRVTHGNSVHRVRISIRRKRGKRCYWLKRRGFKKRSCRKPYYLSARGVSSWKVRLSKRQRRSFKPGKYTLTVRLEDSSKNKIDADGRTRVGFRVKH